MILRQPTPSEKVIVRAIFRRWEEAKADANNRDCFNLIVSHAAQDCGVSYDRAWWLACRATTERGTLPSFLWWMQ